MTAASTPPWPGSRVLLGWWRTLADRHPQQLGFARLLLHHVEALVRVARSRYLDPWQRALLRLASTRVPCGGGLESSFTDLQMDQQVLGRFVRELSDAGLLHQNGVGLWHLTTAGHHALEGGTVAVASEERRTFSFVDQATLGRPPHFLPLRPPSHATPLPPAVAEWSFDVACLETCIRQSPEWKACYHFPADVEALLSPRPDEPPATNYRRVILDCPEPLSLVFLRTAEPAGAPALLGFPVRSEGLDAGAGAGTGACGGLGGSAAGPGRGAVAGGVATGMARVVSSTRPAVGRGRKLSPGARRPSPRRVRSAPAHRASAGGTERRGQTGSVAVGRGGPHAPRRSTRTSAALSAVK